MPVSTIVQFGPTGAIIRSTQFFGGIHPGWIIAGAILLTLLTRKKPEIPESGLVQGGQVDGVPLNVQTKPETWVFGRYRVKLTETPVFLLDDPFTLRMVYPISSGQCDGIDGLGWSRQHSEPIIFDRGIVQLAGYSSIVENPIDASLKMPSADRYPFLDPTRRTLYSRGEGRDGYPYRGDYERREAKSIVTREYTYTDDTGTYTTEGVIAVENPLVYKEHFIKILEVFNPMVQDPANPTGRWIPGDPIPFNPFRTEGRFRELYRGGRFQPWYEVSDSDIVENNNNFGPTDFMAGATRSALRARYGDRHQRADIEDVYKDLVENAPYQWDGQRHQENTIAIGRGLSYVYAEFRQSPDDYYGDERLWERSPPDIDVVLRGQVIEGAWSNNTAKVLEWFLKHRRGATDATIEQTALASSIETCDEMYYYHAPDHPGIPAWSRRESYAKGDIVKRGIGIKYRLSTTAANEWHSAQLNQYFRAHRNIDSGNNWREHDWEPLCYITPQVTYADYLASVAANTNFSHLRGHERSAVLYGGHILLGRYALERFGILNPRPSTVPPTPFPGHDAATPVGNAWRTPISEYKQTAAENPLTDLPGQAVALTFPERRQGESLEEWGKRSMNAITDFPPSRKRYTCGGVFSSTSDHEEVQRQLQIAMGGPLFPYGGQWHFLAGEGEKGVAAGTSFEPVPREPMATLTTEDVLHMDRADVASGWERRYNQVKVQMAQSELHEFLPYEFTVDDEPAQERDGLVLTGPTFSMDYVTSPAQARQNALQALLELRTPAQYVVTCRPGVGAGNNTVIADLKPNDVVTLDIPEVGSPVDCVIVGKEMPPDTLEVRLTLHEQAKDFSVLHQRMPRFPIDDIDRLTRGTNEVVRVLVTVSDEYTGVQGAPTDLVWTDGTFRPTDPDWTARGSVSPGSDIAWRSTPSLENITFIRWTPRNRFTMGQTPFEGGDATDYFDNSPLFSDSGDDPIHAFALEVNDDGTTGRFWESPNTLDVGAQFVAWFAPDWAPAPGSRFLLVVADAGSVRVAT